MPIVAAVTIIVVLLIVVVLAGYLIYVALLLRNVANKLDRVIEGVGSITNKAGPVGPVIREINGALTGVEKALTAVLTKERQPKPPPPPPVPSARGSAEGRHAAPETPRYGPRWVVARPSN